MLQVAGIRYCVKFALTEFFQVFINFLLGCQAAHLKQQNNISESFASVLVHDITMLKNVSMNSTILLKSLLMVDFEQYLFLSGFAKTGEWG